MTRPPLRERGDGEDVSVHLSPDGRTNRERRLAGDWYVADDPVDAETVRRARRLCREYEQAFAQGSDRVGALLAELLGSVGEDVVVRAPLAVDFGEGVHIGARTFVNNNLTALDVATITIGEDCQLGPYVQLLTPLHPLEPGPRRDKVEAADPISIGDNVWLGGGVVVCPGVSIGDDTVVGAGSVVTRDLPAGVLAMGNPARVASDIACG